jgi:hypothetical protein
MPQNTLIRLLRNMRSSSRILMLWVLSIILLGELVHGSSVADPPSAVQEHSSSLLNPPSLLDQFQVRPIITEYASTQHQPQHLEAKHASLRGLKTKSGYPTVSPLHSYVQVLTDNSWTMEDIFTCVVLVLLILCLACCLCSCCCNIVCGTCCNRPIRRGYYDGNDRGYTICGLSMCDILACICIWEICCDDRGSYARLA